MTANLELSLRRLDEQHPVVPEIERALVAAERAASLTHRLLAFSRRQALRPWPIDVNELVEKLVDLLERTLGETIRVTITLEEKLPPSLVDPLELETALINLAINSRDAMPAGGHLLLKTAFAELREDSLEGDVESPGQYVLLQVVDDGVGIPPEDVPRVFEPFFTTKAVGKGSGLGLSMVQGFVQGAGGHVEIKSRPGRGTEVSLYLPVCHGHRPAPATSQRVRRAASTRPPAGAPVVLVVEDDAEFAKAAVSMCESLGYGAQCAGDAEEALEKLPDLPHVRVVLTDVGLPKVSGPDFIERLRTFRPDLMVAWMSGYAVDDVSERLRLDQNTRVLTKPFRRADLGRLLGTLLDEDDPGTE
jgi:CheY-like chemotaxis protein